MKTANKILSTALSLGLILSPIASVGAKDESKETISPQRAKVGTGTTAGQTDKDDDNRLKAGYIVTGIAAAALLAIVLEIAFDGKKDRGVTPPVIPPPGTTPPETTPPETTPPETTPPSTPPTTPPTTTTTTTTTTSSGN
ncbi:MAG: hypothetical protein IH996_08440 [Proteobacteria bacterium]|nr:hypothetical protein [Pseudomonadota bacterium]